MIDDFLLPHPGTGVTRLAGSVALLCLACCGGEGGAGRPPVPVEERVLSGRVVSRGTGGPIAGATVTILDGPGAGRNAVTTSEGRYRIGGLTPGGFTVRASADALDDLLQPMTLGSDPGTLDFRMARAACRQATCDESPSDCNEVLPLFQPPFDGTRRATNLFDHQYPHSYSDVDPVFSSYCGSGNRSGAINGHSGYDWALPEGTPLLAVADGTVTFAGREGSFFCPLLNRDVAGLWVQLETRSPHGERFWAQYLHVSQPLTVAGQAVRAGETIALSGNTGCSTGPHLHLQVLREFSNREVAFGGSSAEVLDPYGWQGPGKDPWAEASGGAHSAWMWIQPPHVSRSADSMPQTGQEPAIQDMNNVPRPQTPR